MHEIKKNVTPPNMCKNFRDSEEKFRFVFKQYFHSSTERKLYLWGKKSETHAFLRRICYKTTTTVNT